MGKEKGSGCREAVKGGRKGKEDERKREIKGGRMKGRKEDRKTHRGREGGWKGAMNVVGKERRGEERRGEERRGEERESEVEKKREERKALSLINISGLICYLSNLCNSMYLNTA